MAKLLLSKEVNASLNEEIKAKLVGGSRKLAIVRVGEREDDLSYERGATKRFATLGMEVEVHALPVDVTEEELVSCIHKLNDDESVDGILLFRPLPKHLNEKAIVNELKPSKDVDGITDASMVSVFKGFGEGFAPCTPSAVMRILEHYDVDLTGKEVVVVGRSLVVGKPLAMMLLTKNATVTICHTKTKDMAEVTRRADIVIVAAGKAGVIGKEHVREGQIVIDVGINVDENGKLCGDVRFDEVSEVVDAITPVPGGVGGVTTSILASHLL